MRITLSIPGAVAEVPFLGSAKDGKISSCYSEDYADAIVAGSYQRRS